MLEGKNVHVIDNETVIDSVYVKKKQCNWNKQYSIEIGNVTLIANITVFDNIAVTI